MVETNDARPGWGLDNVYVGGHDVNPPVLEENFELVFSNGSFSKFL